MFTSLKVVRIAAVDCDCTSRSATRWRRRDIATRCSGRAPSTGDAGGGQALVGAGDAGATGPGLATSAFASIAAATSPLVIRPPRPVPETSPASIFCSAIILRAAGSAVGVPDEAGTPMGAGDDVVDGAEGALFADWGWLAAAGTAWLVDWAEIVDSVGLLPDAVAVSSPLPSVSITAMTSDAITVAPSGLRISSSTPALGAGSSSTTLSVSMSIRFSSRLTDCPTCLCQWTSVASATDS